MPSGGPKSFRPAGIVRVEQDLDCYRTLGEVLVGDRAAVPAIETTSRASFRDVVLPVIGGCRDPGQAGRLLWSGSRTVRSTGCVPALTRHRADRRGRRARILASLWRP
jgi:hypothetical protein